MRWIRELITPYVAKAGAVEISSRLPANCMKEALLSFLGGVKLDHFAIAASQARSRGTAGIAIDSALTRFCE